MNDIVNHFSKIIDYLERINNQNKLEVSLVETIKEQRENLDDLKLILTQFEYFLEELTSCESIESDAMLNKLMKVHKFTTDIEWYASEINELNVKVIKICSAKRK